MLVGRHSASFRISSTSAQAYDGGAKMRRRAAPAASRTVLSVVAPASRSTAGRRSLGRGAEIGKGGERPLLRGRLVVAQSLHQGLDAGWIGLRLHAAAVTKRTPALEVRVMVAVETHFLDLHAADRAQAASCDSGRARLLQAESRTGSPGGSPSPSRATWLRPSRSRETSNEVSERDWVSSGFCE